MTQKWYGTFVVAGLAHGGSAAQSGQVWMHDVVFAVDGKELQGLSMEHAASLMTGEEGTLAHLTLLRGEHQQHRVEVHLPRKPLVRGAPLPVFGVGLGLEPCASGALVNQVTEEEGAAAQAGVLSVGDLVTVIDGESVVGWSVSR
eukprot:CAMPEP_0172034442 /NCGR_PEP_ID=MMETSP1041-20130122/21014_1 /TAXON_ID=464988 /ORGANISM="Hemiselmis andersenii, Strain CCMP439" /LENGTH=144 /DNA_ID=CAMNT_0012691367 /DNA_START=13 /DNA_END=444 /DNA_ORIENTATION=+